MFPPPLFSEAKKELLVYTFYILHVVTSICICIYIADVVCVFAHNLLL